MILTEELQVFRREHTARREFRLNTHHPVGLRQKRLDLAHPLDERRITGQLLGAGREALPQREHVACGQRLTQLVPFREAVAGEGEADAEFLAVAAFREHLAVLVPQCLPFLILLVGARFLNINSRKQVEHLAPGHRRFGLGEEGRIHLFETFRELGIPPEAVVSGGDLAIRWMRVASAF